MLSKSMPERSPPQVGHRPREEVVERLVAHLPHPGRLVLVLRDRLDDLVRDPAARLEEVVARLVRIREPVLDRVVGADPLDDLSLCLCDHNDHFPSTPTGSDSRNESANGGTNDRSVLGRKSPAVELCLPRSLISRALDGASMPLGLGRRPGTQGQCNHPTPRKTTLRRRVGPPGCRR